MRRLLLSFDSSILALAEQVLHDLGRATISVAPTPGFSSVSVRSDSRGLPLPTVEVVFADDIQQPVLEEEPPTLHELFDIDPPSVPPSTPTTPLDLFADLVEDLIDPGFEDSGIDLTCYETIPPSPSQSPQFPDSTVNDLKREFEEDSDSDYYSPTKRQRVNY